MSGKRKLTHPHGAHSACDGMSGRTMDLLAEEFEYLDPNPDIHALFLEYNEMFFDGKLGGCEVKWSKRMTLWYAEQRLLLHSLEVRNGETTVSSGHAPQHEHFYASEPLLKLRPRSDLINTLLHEMIHAFIFVSSPVRDRDDHGPIFQSHMNRINHTAGTVITVYHTFHDEVDTYRQHWWQCDGTCRRKPPYFGIVKRAMNRPPGPLDRWWDDHQKSCGGTYTKIKDPPGFKEKQEKKLQREKLKKEKEKAAPSVRNFFSATSGEGGENATKPIKNPKKPKVSKPEDSRGKKNRKDEPTWLDELRDPSGVVVRPTEGAATSEQPETDPSASAFAVPENAMLVAGDDGEFFLVGDVGALFQFSVPVQHQLQHGNAGLVDLTETDDEEDAKLPPRAAPLTTSSGEVEIIEID